MQIWTPGSPPMEMQPGLVVPVVGGSKLVMQIHYHPVGMMRVTQGQLTEQLTEQLRGL